MFICLPAFAGKTIEGSFRAVKVPKDNDLAATCRPFLRVKLTQFEGHKRLLLRYNHYFLGNYTEIVREESDGGTFSPEASHSGAMTLRLGFFDKDKLVYIDDQTFFFIGNRLKCIYKRIPDDEMPVSPFPDIDPD
jgi:hypothetical protein